jgi:hypothetical protein
MLAAAIMVRLTLEVAALILLFGAEVIAAVERVRRPRVCSVLTPTPVRPEPGI